MNTFNIAQTNLSVSRIAVGCMGLARLWDPGLPSDPQAVAKTQQLIETAMELGINFFDHADIYGRGKSETLFGHVLRQSPALRQRMVLQSKCGIRFRGEPTADMPQRYDFDYDHIVRSVEGSLQRLSIEQLDLLLLHRPDPLVEPDEVARAFDHLHQSGKVRYFGVSNHSQYQIELLARSLRQPLVVNQLQLSLAHPWLIDEGIGVNQTGVSFTAGGGLLDYCRLNGILVQAWSPTARGRLSQVMPDMTDRELRIAGVVAQVAAELQTTTDAVILAWLLRHPAGIQPVVGTTNPQRLRDNVLADTVKLSREQWWRLLASTRAGRVP